MKVSYAYTHIHKAIPLSVYHLSVFFPFSEFKHVVLCPLNSLSMYSLPVMGKGTAYWSEWASHLFLWPVAGVPSSLAISHNCIMPRVLTVSSITKASTATSDIQEINRTLFPELQTLQSHFPLSSVSPAVVAWQSMHDRLCWLKKSTLTCL